MAIASVVIAFAATGINLHCAAMKFPRISLITAVVAPLPSSAKKAASTFNFVYPGSGLAFPAILS